MPSTDTQHLSNLPAAWLTDTDAAQCQADAMIEASVAQHGESSIRTALPEALQAYRERGELMSGVNPFALQQLVRELDHLRSAMSAGLCLSQDSPSMSIGVADGPSAATQLLNPDYWTRSVRGVAKAFILEFPILDRARLATLDASLVNSGETLTALLDALKVALRKSGGKGAVHAPDQLIKALRTLASRIDGIPEDVLLSLDCDPQASSQLAVLARSAHYSIGKYNDAIIQVRT